MTKTFLKAAVLGGTALALGLLSTAPAHAFTFTPDQNSVTITASDLGKSFTALFNGQVGKNPATPILGLSANAIFTFASASATEALFNVVLNNTSTGPITSSRVSVLGFNTTPNAVGVGPTNGSGNTRITNPGTTGFTQDSTGNIPNLGQREVCFSANDCAAGAGAGVTLGNSGNFSFALGLNGNNPFTLSDFFVRYQDVNGSTVVPPGGSAEGVGKVPTPALLPGLIALGASVLRKRKGEQMAEANAEV